MSTDTPTRPLPALTPETEFFWTSGADGRLRFLRCDECYSYVHPPAPVCPRCSSRALTPEPVSGRGTVLTFTVNHQEWGLLPTPDVIAIVQLAEDPALRLTTNLVGVAPDDVRSGMPVQVRFEHIDDVYLPLFEPAS
jgi:uncharacterized OB-fold protein